VSWVFQGVPSELVNMVRKMFSRKSEEGVTEADLGSTRYAPKITMEEYNNTKINLDTSLDLNFQPSVNKTIITSNVSMENENTKVVNVTQEKQKSTKKENIRATLPRLNLSPDSYATNIYCQVRKVGNGKKLNHWFEMIS
jgi:hypothetical protein